MNQETFIDTFRITGMSKVRIEIWQRRYAEKLTWRAFAAARQIDAMVARIEATISTEADICTVKVVVDMAGGRGPQ